MIERRQGLQRPKPDRLVLRENNTGVEQWRWEDLGFEFEITDLEAAL